MEPIRALLIGAGNRGMDAYGNFALRHPYLFRFVGVADINEKRRTRFAELHGIPAPMVVSDWSELLADSPEADVVFVCTPDRLHVEPARAAMRSGFDVVLEKPIAVDYADCRALAVEAEQLRRHLIVCHVLRHTPFFTTIKELLDTGVIGRLLTVSMTECIGFYHFAHSYVRGNWRSAATSSPIILAKSCHDMDILYWLTGSPASRVSSSGSRVWFRKENAPKGAAERCLDDCPHRTLCPFYAPRWYLGSNEGWPASVISEDRSLDARIEAIRTGPYGRCVYACDNDVADQQGVIISFENGVIATFTLSAFTQDIDRTIRLMGSAGEIYGDLKQGRIECTDFLTGSKRAIRVKAPENGHHGGDDALMYEVESVLRASDRRVKSRSDIAEALEGHLICFAAEQARLENRTVDMEVFRQSL